MRAQIRSFLRRFHQDTRGAMSVEKVLILGLIALPIVVILLAFRRTIVEWFVAQRDQLKP